MFRALLRVGLPVFCLIFAAGWFFSAEDNRSWITTKVAEIRQSVAERPEFMVKLLAIDGASDGLSDDIRAALPIDFPISSFDLDLEEMRAAVEALDAVAHSDLIVQAGGILQVKVIERMPAVVWRVGSRIDILDETGQRVAPLVHRRDRADLGLIVGEGAERHVPEALNLFAAAAPLEPRLRGLVRVGERRWDLVLDRNQRIMLPETRPVDALEQVIALHQAQDVLARDLYAVDMRTVTRPTLRMAPPALEELRRIKSLELGEDF